MKHLTDYSRLSFKQLGILRDAGLTKEQSRRISYKQFQDVAPTIMKKRASDAALPTQLTALSNIFGTNEVNGADLSYTQARKILRDLALEAGDDEDYLDYIQWQDEFFHSHNEMKARGIDPASDPFAAFKGTLGE